MHILTYSCVYAKCNEIRFDLPRCELKRKKLQRSSAQNENANIERIKVVKQNDKIEKGESKVNQE